MRIMLAAAAIGACLAGSYTFASVYDLAKPLSEKVEDKQPQQGKPGATGGNDSCRWANDRECDDPDIGTGACSMGTDFSDCRNMRAGVEDDSCQWARDGECDEPHWGTGACVQATDATDCREVSWLRNLNDSCGTAFNGACEEPGRGNGCEARTDRSDCRGRARPMTINDHFFGRDDRVRVNAREAPWTYMGRITNSNEESCTATLIARDVLVTAAHCIHADNQIATGATFVAENGGAQANAVAYMISPQFNYERFTSSDDIDGLDWALVRLDRPLGAELGFAGVRSLSSQPAATSRAADLYQAGYSWDTGQTLSGNIACHLVRFYPDNTFSHQCDTTQGDSGSAFLVRNGAGFDVIGVDSNYRENPDGPVINIAVGAASWQRYVSDFTAGRIGTRFGANATGKPKRD